MRKNIGSSDKLVRFLIAAVLVGLYFSDVLSGTVAIVSLVAAGVLVFTSLINFCPLYYVLGIKTCKTVSKS
jgi:hypothetical protein